MRIKPANWIARHLGGIMLSALLGLLIAVGFSREAFRAIEDGRLVKYAKTESQSLNAAKEVNISVGNDMEIVTYLGNDDVFGYSQKEILGRNIDLLIPTDIAIRHNFMSREVMEQGLSVRRTVKCSGKRKDGSFVVIEIEVTVFPEENDQGVRATAKIKEL